MGDQPVRPIRTVPEAMSYDAQGQPVIPPRAAHMDVQHLEYFHPQFASMEQVKKVMMPFLKKNGSFLLRLSLSSEKTFTVSVVHNGAIKHFKILRKNQQFYLQDRLFYSISELVLYYQHNSVPNVEQIKDVCLLYPIKNKETHLPRQSSEPSFQRQMSGIEQLLPRRSSSTAIPSPGGGQISNPNNKGSPTRMPRRKISAGSFGEADYQSSVGSPFVGSPISSGLATGGGKQRINRTSAGSSIEEEDPRITYNKIFQKQINDVRPLPAPPGSRLMTEQMVPTRVQSFQERVPQSLEPMPTRRAQSSIEQRPPAPLPPDASTSTSSGDGIYNGVYYSCIKRNPENKLPQLLDTLSMAPVTESTHCECGLDLELSQLPMGWSIHISREPDAGYGRPFFVSSSQVTCWDLPKEVYLDLNRHQQKFIKFLCDNYEQGNAPPDEDTQIQWSSSSSDSYTGSGPSYRGNSKPKGSSDGASGGQRDSTGSNTGASQGSGYTSRGVASMDASGAEM